MLRNKSPVIILVSPQLGENIGAAARVMKNFEFDNLRIVSPRDGWPNKKSYEMASGADDILDKAEIFDNLKNAIADLNFLCAVTARKREMLKAVYSSEEIGEIISKYIQRKQKCGIMFGSERIGLTNEDITLADSIVNIPANHDYSSLNLAQAVAILCYEFYMSVRKRKTFESGNGLEKVATRGELIGFLEHLETELDRTGHFKSPEMRYKMIENLRNSFVRAGLTEQEVRTLRGVITSLTKFGE